MKIQVFENVFVNSQSRKVCTGVTQRCSGRFLHDFTNLTRHDQLTFSSDQSRLDIKHFASGISPGKTGA